MVNVNKIDFSSGGHTITMTQSTAPGIRAMTGVQNQIQFTGSHNGTISHAAVSQNLGFFRDTGSTRTLTITNAYSHLINPLDDYGSGFTFTNRWGIYQAGASDNNYFAGKTLIGTTTVGTQNLQVLGTALFQTTTGSSTNFVIETLNGDRVDLQIKNSEGSFSLTSNNNVHNITNSNTAISFQDTIPGVRIANGSGGFGADGNMLFVSGTKNSFNNNSRGIFINTTLVAVANGDTLVGLEVNATYTNGAFTGVKNYAIKTTGNINMSSLPTSSAGLSAGDLWNNLGILNIV